MLGLWKNNGLTRNSSCSARSLSSARCLGLINCEGCGLGQTANTHTSWICAGFNLAGKEIRGSCGRSCRGKGRSAGARWRCAAHQRCSVWHGARWCELLLDDAQCFILDLSQARCKMSDDDNLTSSAHEKNVCGKVFLSTHTVAHKGIAIACKRNSWEKYGCAWVLVGGCHIGFCKESVAFALFTTCFSPFVVSTSCRMVAIGMMKKNSLRLLQEYNISIRILFMFFELLFWSLSNLILRMNSCVNISCCCCIFSVQPVTSFLYFLQVIALIHGSICNFRVQHELPRVFVSASFPSCRNVRMVLWCDRVAGSMDIFISSYLGLWLSIMRTVQESLQYGLVTLFFCLPECIVGFVMNSLPLSWSVSSSRRNSLLDNIIRDWKDIRSIFVQSSILWRRLCNAYHPAENDYRCESLINSKTFSVSQKITE